MDDLMNRVGALIEEHVEGEVEARGLIKARSDTERLKVALRVQAQHSDLVSSTLETVRDILGAPPGAEFATDAARRVVKERDELKAERDSARFASKVAHEQLAAVRCERDMLRERAQAADAKLFEVRNAAGEKAPAESAKAPPKPSEFQVGDLVARHMCGPGCWGTVQAVDGDYIQVSYPAVGEGLYCHTKRELTRKPVEPGDRVRVTGELCGGSPFAGRVGTARAKEFDGLYGEWRIDKPEGGSFATCAKLVVAIAP